MSYDDSYDEFLEWVDDFIDDEDLSDEVIDSLLEWIQEFQG